VFRRTHAGGIGLCEPIGGRAAAAAVVSVRVSGRDHATGAHGRRPGGSGSGRSRPAAGGSGFAFRADIEGLRGLATVLVLIYHAGVPLSGGGYVGLDVFFVISGFLITGLLLKEFDGTGRIALGRFYLRRIRRLLPSVVAVLAAIVVMGWILMTPLARDRLAGDVLAANFYYSNWRFAGQEGDYLTRGLDASPVQHFWSLSVEEQFYAVWPLVVLAAGWWAVRRAAGPRAGIAVVVLLAGVILFGHSVERTAVEAGPAYFSTFARGWEFAVGAAVALIPAGRLRLTPRVASLVVWAGLATLAWCTVTYDVDTAFPGPAALVPCVAAAAIIVAGLSTTRTVPARLLATAAPRWVGRISYSWYLWHWPLLVFAAILWGDLSPLVASAVVIASVVPALVAHHLVEEPFRRSRRLSRSPRLAFGVGAACVGSIAVLTVGASFSVPSVPVASAKDAVGMSALEAGAPVQEHARAIRPVPKSAIRDRGRADADGCLVEQRDTRSGPCVYGDRSSETTAVLFGDSHAAQYFPALEIVAEERGWRVVVLTKSGCTPADVEMWNAQFRRRYRECERWRARAITRIQRERPALILVGNLNAHTVVRDGGRLDRGDSARALEAGMVRTLRRLRATGASVALITDNPRPTLDVRGCVSRSLDSLRDCAFTRGEAFAHAPVNSRAAARVRGVRRIDPTPVLCPTRLCPAVIGNVLVYRNTAHITATYMATLAPWLGERLPRPARR